MRELELLAPARNIEIGIAAIDCGADAVYLAGPAFGARQAAGNSVEDIRRLCSYAHKFGARVFVTLNTIIFDEELEEAFGLAVQMQEAGADALIVQDFALPAFELERAGSLSILLHASTQCSIRTVEEARRMDALGFSRIVLERELPLSTVREICSAVSCEVEAFVHGALCVCYSGQCYLSEMLSGRSANRGECVQACRSRYDLVNSRGELVRWPELRPDLTLRKGSGMSGGNKYGWGHPAGKPVAEDRTLLSLRDLNLLERLPEMADAGVDSFKIEGRLKSISYVRNIVSAYSQALDRFVTAHPGQYRRASFGHSAPGFVPSPGKSFNRGFTQLYFDGRRDSQWACLDAGKALGEEVGTVAALSRTRDWMKITVKTLHETSGSTMKRAGTPFSAKKGDISYAPVPIRFHNGDGFSFIGRDGKEHGFRADICDGNTILCKAVDGLTPGMCLYRNLDTAFEKELEKGAVRRIGVSLSVEINDSPLATLRSEANDIRVFQINVKAISEDGREVLYTIEMEAEPARNTERMLCMISGQLGKDSGIYRFSVNGINRNGTTVNGQEAEGYIPMMSAAQLNAIRREIAERLDKLPCHARPLNRAAIKDSLPESLKFPKRISYKSDVANNLAAGLYKRLGAETVEPAYESINRGLQQSKQLNETSIADTSGQIPKGREQAKGIELMRSKYCLLHELGLCRKTPVYAALAAANNLSEGLFLRNNGRLLHLDFDCKSCEMVVLTKPHA